MKYLKLLRKIIFNVLLLTTILTIGAVNNSALAATKTNDFKMPKDISNWTVIEKHDEILDAKKLFEIAKDGKDPNVKIKDYDSNGKIKSVSQIVGKYKDPSSDAEITKTNVTAYKLFKTKDIQKDDMTTNIQKDDIVTENFLNDGTYNLSIIPKELLGSKVIDDSMWDKTDSVEASMTSTFYTYYSSGNQYVRLENAVVSLQNYDSTVNINYGTVKIGQTGILYSGNYLSQGYTDTFYGELSDQYYYPNANWYDVYKIDDSSFYCGAVLKVYLWRGSASWNMEMACTY
jgi:hypothetical protein